MEKTLNTIICPKCNTEINAEYHYCPHCGEPISDLAKEREMLKAKNAGLMKLAEFAKHSNSEQVLLAVEAFIENKK